MITGTSNAGRRWRADRGGESRAARYDVVRGPVEEVEVVGNGQLLGVTLVEVHVAGEEVARLRPPADDE